MTAAEIRNWKRAANIAYVAMGKTEPRRGRGWPAQYRAEDDPLAWWCLTEWIMAFKRDRAREGR